MSPQQLSKVYSVIGIFLLYFTIDTWSVTRGGQIIFGSKGVDPHRVHAAVNGIPIFSFLLCLISIVGIIYAGRSGIDAKWHSRVPILGFESMNTGSLEGKLYQAASLIGSLDRSGDRALKPLDTVVHGSGHHNELSPTFASEHMELVGAD